MDLTKFPPFMKKILDIQKLIRLNEILSSKNPKGVKSMDKRNLKKAALLGIAIGALATGQAATAHEPSSGLGMTLAHGCAGGCGGKSRRAGCGSNPYPTDNGAIADADEPALQNQQNQRTRNGCAAQQPVQNTQPMPQNGQNTQPRTSGGCQARAMPQRSAGCASQPMPQGRSY